MESLSPVLSSLIPHKPQHPKPPQNPSSPSPSNNPSQSHFHLFKIPPHLSIPKPLKTHSKPHLSLPILLGFLSSSPFSSLASEIPILTDPSASGKISLEAIVVSIDDFFNRNPFFVYGVAFIWLIVIPVLQAEFRKCKFVSAVDAFVKLRDDPCAQLIDIRDERSLVGLGSPNLKILNKEVVQVWFSEGDEEGFLKKVLERFEEPQDTVVCILDNFDGNSMKAAELLFNNGFKEAYAMEGGVLGKKGWKDIQEKFLPLSVHIYKKKKVKKSVQQDVNGVLALSGDKVQASTYLIDTESIIAAIDNNHYANVEPPSPASPLEP